MRVTPRIFGHAAVLREEVVLDFEVKIVTVALACRALAMYAEGILSPSRTGKKR